MGYIGVIAHLLIFYKLPGTSKFTGIIKGLETIGFP